MLRYEACTDMIPLAVRFDNLCTWTFPVGRIDGLLLVAPRLIDWWGLSQQPLPHARCWMFGYIDGMGDNLDPSQIVVLIPEHIE